MTHVHRLSGQRLRIIEHRSNGSGLFEDSTGRVVCDMRLVEDDRDSGYHSSGKQAIAVNVRAANK